MQTLDLIIILIYLIGTTALGWFLSRGQKNLRDYFVGDRDVPWWAITFSIVATETSAVTFISIPGKAYTGNMTFLQLVLGYMIGRVVIVLLLIPLYFRGELYTVYQVLERRFGARTKRSAATLFLITRSLADGLRLLLAAYMLRELTGWNSVMSILVMTGATLVYTYLGGMKAVIWTDVIQLFVYLIGAGVAGWIVIDRVPGGWNQFISTAHDAGKFRIFDFAWDISSSYTFWAGLIGGAFLTTATHGTDQLMVQRYLCARSSKQASAALLASGAVILGQFILFLMIGAALFVFYGGQKFDSPDQVFPRFIVTQLPSGMVGLVAAAVFAAAMSTVSSSLNSSATTSMTDFYRPLIKPDGSDAHYLKVSRWMTLGWGGVQCAVALAATAAGMNTSIVDQVLTIAAFTNGPVLGLFLLGALTRRVSEAGALVGLAVGIASVAGIYFGMWHGFDIRVAFPWLVVVGSIITFVAGCAAGLVMAPAAPVKAVEP